MLSEAIGALPGNPAYLQPASSSAGLRASKSSGCQRGSSRWFAALHPHRMHELADPAAELIHWWDDDDLYLPWHLEDCLEHIGRSVAWKPASSWISENNVTFSRQANNFEGSWIFQADYLKSAPLNTHPTYTDHPVIQQTQDAGLLTTTELGGRTSYIYRWAIGTEHVSGYAASGSEETQQIEHRLVETEEHRCAPRRTARAGRLDLALAAISRWDPGPGFSRRVEAKSKASGIGIHGDGARLTVLARVVGRKST